MVAGCHARAAVSFGASHFSEGTRLCRYKAVTVLGRAMPGLATAIRDGAVSSDALNQVYVSAGSGHVCPA